MTVKLRNILISIGMSLFAFPFLGLGIFSISAGYYIFGIFCSAFTVGIFCTVLAAVKGNTKLMKMGVTIMVLCMFMAPLIRFHVPGF